MKEIKIRQSKPDDAYQIAEVHVSSLSVQKEKK